MGINDVTAFAKWSGPAIDDIQAIDREYNLKKKVASVPHNDAITVAFFANDEPAVANNQAGQYSSALVSQLNRHQRRGWLT